MISASRYFPTKAQELLFSWPPFYPGQENLQVKVRLISTPPDYKWKLRIIMTGRDGKILYTAIQDQSESFLPKVVDVWREVGFQI